MRSPVTAMVTQFHGLSEVEQKVFLDLVDPQPEEQSAKRARAKRGRSKEATGIFGLAEAIRTNIQAGVEATRREAAKDSGPLCGICGNAQDYQDHFQPSPNYHEFEGPKPVARAPSKSSKKSAAPLSDQSSETGTDAAGVAASAASAGD